MSKAEYKELLQQEIDSRLKLIARFESEQDWNGLKLYCERLAAEILRLKGEVFNYMKMR
jgi:hypothetical protein